MIVEERKTKAKAQLRFLVLLVKFLMILKCVNKDTEHRLSLPHPRPRSNASQKYDKEKRGRMRRAQRGTEGQREYARVVNIVPFFSLLLYFSSNFLHAQFHGSCIIGQSNDSTHFFLIISRATFLVPFSLHSPSSLHSSSHAHASFLSHFLSHTDIHTPRNYAFSLCWSFLLPA